MRRLFHSILTGLSRLVGALLHLLWPASLARDRGRPSSRMAPKAKAATKGNQNKVTPRKHDNVDKPRRRKLTAEKEHQNVDKLCRSGKLAAAKEEDENVDKARSRKEGELDILERMRLRGEPISVSRGQGLYKRRKHDPDRVAPYKIIARVPRSAKHMNARDWFESFIPKVADDSVPSWNRPRLEELNYNGFSAGLSARHVEEMKKKMPGFQSAHLWVAHIH